MPDSFVHGYSSVKSYQCHFIRKIDYYFDHNANSCIFFFFYLVKISNQVTTGNKLLKIGENCQGRGESMIMERVAHYGVFTY